MLFPVLSASAADDLECLVKPLRDGAAELIAEYRAFFAADDLLVVELDARVVDLALRLRAGDGLRTPDALQAASALTLPAGGHRFLTNDRRFVRIAGLRVIDFGATPRPDPAEQDCGPPNPWERLRAATLQAVRASLGTNGCKVSRSSCSSVSWALSVLCQNSVQQPDQVCDHPNAANQPARGQGQADSVRGCGLAW